MAAGGFREFIAGEVLDEDKINDFLMQGILVFADAAARDAAITAPVEGQFAFLKDSDTLTFHDGTSFVDFESGVQPAEVSGTTGSPTIATVGSFEFYGFKSSGSITFDKEGLIDVLYVGGGGGGGDGQGNNPAGGGGAGGVLLAENVYVEADTYTVTRGAGGARGTSGTPGAAGSNGADSLIVGLGPRGLGGGGSNFGLGLASTGGGESRRGGSGAGASARFCLPGTSVGGQGNDGGTTADDGAGGGGGAGAAGSNGASSVGGNGGVGTSAFSAFGSAVSAGQVVGGQNFFAGGGGGGTRSGATSVGGNGGGGAGAVDAGNAGNGTANTGGGGGGAEEGLSGNGGSGIVIVRVAV